MNTKLKLSLISRFQKIQTGIEQYPGTRVYNRYLGNGYWNWYLGTLSEHYCHRVYNGYL